VALALCLGVLLLASCRTDRSLDANQLERDLAAQILAEYPGAIDSVRCPEIPEPIPGDSFDCIARLGDAVIVVAVVVGGTVEALTTEASIDARFVAVNEVAALLAATFSDEVGLATSVDCGRPVMVLEPNELIRCAATDPAGVTRFFDVAIGEGNELTITLR
jgi:hypothetical protein